MEYAELCIKWICICGARLYGTEVLMEIVKEEPENIKFLITITLLIALAIYVFRFIWVFLWYKDFYFPKNINII